MSLLNANQRFFDVQHKPHETLLPIPGYEDMPVLSLKMSVENLETIIPKATQNAHIATERSLRPDNGLTQDESAAICLYTMNWKPNNQSLCTRLNDALRSKDRSELIPYFFYLKLFLSALWKLKSVKKTVWRGVKADLRNEYPRGKIIIWWGFSSCLESIDEIQSDKFIGKTGSRTLFQIECETGKAINAHSYYHDINEVLLFPATQFQVIDQIHSSDGLSVLRMKEIKSSFAFLQPPFSSSTLNTSIKRSEQKVSSAPTLSLARGVMNFSNIQRSKSSYISSSSSNISKIQPKLVKKPTKPYENNVLKELIKQERTKRFVRFSKQFFNHDDMEIIADELTSNKCWTIMYLWENCMNERHMRILMRGLKVNSTVMCLNLDHNLLGDDGASVLASTLKINTFLRSIYLNDNHISDVGAEELSQMLYVNRTLTHLELSSNTIGDSGVIAISNALKVNKYLRTLCLNNNKITKIGAQHLGEMLQVNKTLTDLQLTSNAIGDDGVISIIHALEQNDTLESIDISETMMSVDSMHNIKEMLEMNNTLKCLYLNNNHFGDDALMMIIPALIQNRTLTTLDLSMNDLTEKSAKKLGYLLKEERETMLTTLIISHNPLGDEGIGWIACALKNNRTLVKLMIESVEISTEGVRELSMMLCSNEDLRYLSLNNNQIDDNGMTLLVDALKYNRSLEYLYLNNCDLNDECVPLIIDMMKESKTLMSIELVKNHLTQHGKTAIKEAMTEHITCTVYLDFTFH